MAIIEEVLVANGVAILMMVFLLICRRKNRENIHLEDRVYDGMAAANFLGALSETIAFVVDGRVFVGGRAINYLTNSLCFMSTVSIGLLWCVYVELRIYRNYKRVSYRLGVEMIPWIVEALAILYNLFGTNFVFKISESNVYERGPGVIIGYTTLVIYFAHSIYLVHHSKRMGINLDFFPILFFVGPCFAGVVLQYLFYGITTSWVLVAVALTFVQTQLYAENLYMDELSGLYNRRYYNAVLARRENANRGSLHGILMDINDFKDINDRLGHNTGDHAICTLGEILFKSIPDTGMAIRYAGDEFIVLLSGVDAARARATMKEINHNLEQFNRSGQEPFTLSVSMGHAAFGKGDNAETFLTHMDEKMYEEKRKYHARTQSKR